MMLIADSGSTKTDWCVILDNTPIKRIGTKGLNPFFQSEEEIQQELTHPSCRNCRKEQSTLFTFTVQAVHPRKLPPSGGQ